MNTIPRQTLTQLANRYLEERLPALDFDVDDDELFTRWSDDLADEFDAALDDRWLEWLEIRRKGVPLGVHVVDAGDREIATALTESGAAGRAEGVRLKGADPFAGREAGIHGSPDDRAGFAAYTDGRHPPAGSRYPCRRKDCPECAKEKVDA